MSPGDDNKHAWWAGLYLPEHNTCGWEWLQAGCDSDYWNVRRDMVLKDNLAGDRLCNVMHGRELRRERGTRGATAGGSGTASLGAAGGSGSARGVSAWWTW